LALVVLSVTCCMVLFVYIVQLIFIYAVSQKMSHVWLAIALTHTAAADHVDDTIVAGKRQSLLMAGDDDNEVLWQKPQRYAACIRSGKSEAAVTIIKDCAGGIRLLVTHTQSIAQSRSLSATAELLVGNRVVEPLCHTVPRPVFSGCTMALYQGPRAPAADCCKRRNHAPCMIF